MLSVDDIPQQDTTLCINGVPYSFRCIIVQYNITPKRRVRTRVKSAVLDGPEGGRRPKSGEKGLPILDGQFYVSRLLLYMSRTTPFREPNEGVRRRPHVPSLLSKKVGRFVQANVLEDLSCVGVGKCTTREPSTKLEETQLLGVRVTTFSYEEGRNDRRGSVI